MFADFQPTYITVERYGGVTLVRLSVPRLTDEENIEQFGRELFALLDQYGCEQVVLDLAGVAFVTSGALGKLITLHRRLHRRDGMLVLCGAEGDLAEMLRTSRLADYFNVAPDIDGAIKVLTGPRVDG